MVMEPSQVVRAKWVGEKVSSGQHLLVAGFVYEHDINRPGEVHQDLPAGSTRSGESGAARRHRDRHK